MIKKNSFKIFATVFVIVLSTALMTCRTFAAPVTNQESLLLGITTAGQVVDLDFQVSEITLDNQWNSIVNPNLLEVNITTLLLGSIVKPVIGTTNNFLNFKDQGSMKLSLDGNSSLEISNFSIESSSMNAFGGAIYSNGDAEFSGGTYFFDNNSTSTAGNRFAHGGAIYAGGNLNLTSGNFSFTGNFAKVFGVGTGNAHGGAIYIKEKLTISNGEYNFSNNYVDVESTSASRTSAYGGAIYAESAEFSGDRFTFVDNYAKVSGAGEYIAHGGAIYIGGPESNPIYNLKMFQGEYIFEGNTSTIDVQKLSYARGGAIYVKNTMEAFDGEYLFINNTAISVSNTGNALGGAIYADVLKILNGNYDFINNRVVASGTGRGSGGAISVGDYLILKGGMFRFIENSAIGSSTGTGYGGAIFIRNRLEAVGGEFVDNFASTYGGAIYVDSTASSTSEIKIEAANYYNVIFTGNMQGTEANSIYFGGKGNIEVLFTVDEESQFIMADPMSSSSSVTLIEITKNGMGVWQLGGNNIFNAKTELKIAEGTLLLLPNAHINMPKTDSILNVSESGYIIASIGNTVSTINTNKTSLTEGSTIGLNLVNDRYIGSELSLNADNSYVVFELLSSTSDITSVNNLTLDSMLNQGTKEFTYGLYKYVFDEVVWQQHSTTNNTWQLVLKGLSKSFDPSRIGEYAFVVPGRMAISNSVSGLALNRALGAFDSKENKRYLWFDNLLMLSHYYDSCVLNASFTIGVDSIGFENFFIGALVRISIFGYEGIDIKADSINPAASVYMAFRLPFGFIIGGGASYGLNVIDQERFVENDVLDSNYLSGVLSAYGSLSKKIELGNFYLTPQAKYEYMRINVQKHQEESRLEEHHYSFALEYTEMVYNIHKVSGGLLFGYNSKNLGVEVKAFYLGSFGDTLVSSTTRLANDLSGQMLNVSGYLGDTHNLDFGAKLSYKTKQNTIISLEYSGVFSKNTSSHGINLNVSVKI